MNRTLWLLPVLLLTSFNLAEAQQPTKIPRIGYLAAASPSANVARYDAFRQGLRELGYVEGKNIVIDLDMQRENSIASPRSRPS